MKPPYPDERANPYAPPSDQATAPAEPWASGAPTTHGLAPAGSGALWIRWLLLACYVGGILLFIPGWSLLQPHVDRALAPLGFTLTILAMLCVLTYALFVCTWILMSWSMIPSPAQRTRTGKRISPGAAVGLTFVPIYNCYWVFAQSVGLCDALNRQLVAFGATKRAPRGLAIAASIVQLVPCVNLLCGPVLWLSYIFVLDAAKAEYSRAARAAGHAT